MTRHLLVQFSVLLLLMTLGRPGAAQEAGSPLGRATTDRIDRIFAGFDHVDTPGCMLGVTRRGSFLYRRGYGMAHLEHRVPWSDSTVTQIRSLSKHFTAMAVLLLAADGKVSLDDPVRRYIPELPEYQSQPVITIRHLLNQTSGIRDYRSAMELRGIDNERRYTIPEAIELVSRQQGLNFTPGTRFGYSNSNYFLLALIVERVSGQSLRDFADERIFDPLGMKDTHFHDDLDEIVVNRAQGYTPRPDGELRISEDASVSVGAGGLYTTLADLARWDGNFATAKVGGERVLKQLQTPGTFADGRTSDYAAGLWVGTRRGLPFVRHDGGGAGYRSEMLRFPEQGRSVFVLCNTTEAPAVGLAAAVADVLLEGQYTQEGEGTDAAVEELHETYVTVPQEALIPLTGLYGGVGDRTLFEIAVQDEGLVIVFNNQAGFELSALGQRKFRVRNFPNGAATVEFTGGSDARPSAFLFDLEGLPEPLTIEARAEADSAALAAYGGRYYSRELDATYVIAPVREGLQVRLAGLVDRPLFGPLRLLADDTFVGLGKEFAFERDSTGGVAGFTLDWSRVQGVHFTKIAP